ncbi:hypothetical protein LMIY3S_00466 [Labrys miyagiensis]
MRYRPVSLALTALLAAAHSAHADCTVDFATVMKAYHDAGPRKVETEITFTSSKPGESSTRTSIARIVLPDALDLHMADGADRDQSEAVLVGGKGFTRIDGGWKPLPDEAVGELRTLFLGGGFMGEEPRNVQCLGTRKLGHKPFSAYSFEIPGVPKTMTVTLYADPATGRPVEATGAAVTHLSGEELKVTYTYDPGIRIEAPN